MIGVVVFLGLLAACSLAGRVALLTSRHGRARRTPAAVVRFELFVADRRVDAEYQRARRAMNEAAGQSWRNLAG